MDKKSRIIRGPEIWGRTGRSGLSRVTVYRRERAGRFPRRIRLGPNSVGWYEGDFEEWLSDPENYQAPDLEQGGQR